MLYKFTICSCIKYRCHVEYGDSAIYLVMFDRHDCNAIDAVLISRSVITIDINLQLFWRAFLLAVPWQYDFKHTNLLSTKSQHFTS